LYATPFILDRDITNKYKVNDKVERTSQFTNCIPFLRAPAAEWKHATSSPRGHSANFDQVNNTFT